MNSRTTDLKIDIAKQKVIDDSQTTSAQQVAAEKRTIVDLLHLDSDAGIAFNDVGWNSRVYVVNSGEFVFKFPRYGKVKEYYELEIASCRLAESIQGEVAVPKCGGNIPPLTISVTKELSGTIWKTV